MSILRPRAASAGAFVFLVLAALVLAGCRPQETVSTFVPRERTVSGEPRAFLMGFSDVPGSLTEDAYTGLFDLTANFGEVILIQRRSSWAEFLPGARVSEALDREVVAARDAARARGLQVVAALDPFDPTQRGRLGSLPAEYSGRSLADQDLRRAFVAEASYLARALKPEFMVLGTEVNATFERNPEGYFAFLEAYAEAYDAVKAASPRTQVMVTYQFEEFMGVVPELPPHAPRWDLLDDLGERVDLIGITSYPSFAYPTARKVPPAYYLDLREHTDLPVAFVGVGFASTAGREGVNSGTQPEQRRFLQRLLEDADRLGSPLVVWFAAQDLGFAAAPPYDLLATIGLRDTSDAPKEAWPVWESASQRPIDVEAAVARRAELDAQALEVAPTPTEEAAEEATPAGD